MTMRLVLIFAATALASAGGLASKPAAAQTGAAASQAPPSEAKALVESCSAHKFETTVDVTVDGKIRSSKVKLCGKVGQSDADWMGTLKDAARKVEANTALPKAERDQIISALNAEISKIEAVKPVASALPSTPRPPAERPPEYSTLPPLPTAPKVATRSHPTPAGPPP
jgi:ribosomal protein S11